MANEVTSKHLKAATELTLVADIRPGLVGSSDVVSYASRLGILLNGLFELRQRQIEAGSTGSVGPLELLHSLYFVRWSILDGSRLMLAVSFDSPWETYIRAIVDDAGPLLDVIFCHCVGYQGSSTADGYLKFGQWVRERQVNIPFFYAADGSLTVTDLEYLKKFQAAVMAGSSPEELVRLNALPTPPTPPAVSRESVSAIHGAARVFQQFEQFFPSSPDPKNREREFFRAATWEILRGLSSPALLAEPSVVKSPLQIPGYIAHLETESKARVAKARALPVQPSLSLGLREEVQGNVLTGYPRMTHGCLVLLGFDSGTAARRFLKELSGSITPDRAAGSAKGAVNVALTLQGLRTLGVTEEELSVLPKEFREGMAVRAPMLGDVGNFHPSRWELPRMNWQLGATEAEDSFQSREVVPLGTVDMLVKFQEQAPESADDHLWNNANPCYGSARRLVADKPGVRVLHVQALRREYWRDEEGRPTGHVREHFGFKEGLSQPVPRLDGEVRANQGDEVSLGDVLLGHPSTRGECYPPEDPPEFLRNASFLVVRKLEQHVGAFSQFLNTHAQEKALPEDTLAAKLMGRTRSGEALVPLAKTGSNDFDYSEDPLGDGCPLRSHVRRSNPRTPPRESVHGFKVTSPRILRRGFSYGPSVASGLKDSRGLMFMAYNASIAEQYEVVQRWVNGGNSTGLLSSQNDPIVGACQGPQVISLIHEGKAVQLTKPTAFVTVKWGLYLLAPSLSGVRALAERGRSVAPSVSAAAKAGEAIIQRLAQLERMEVAQSGHASTSVECAGDQVTAGCEWKKLLEDRLAAEKASNVWAAIRELHQGALRTPYGVLVGDAQGVANVLANEPVFSVRRYWERMTQSVGGLYLGMDRSPCPMAKPSLEDKTYEAAVVPTEGEKVGSYDQDSPIPNQAIRGIGVVQAFQAAESIAKLAIDAQLEQGVLELRVLGAGVVSKLSQAWFGYPNAPAPGATAGVGILEFADFLATGRNVFFAHPDPLSIQKPVAESKRRFEEALLQPPSDTEFAKQLARAGKTPRQIQQAALGATQGFVVPTISSIVSVLMQWLESGKLWRMGQWLGGVEGRDLLGGAEGRELLGGAEGTSVEKLEASLLFREMIRALRTQPSPNLLHRTSTASVKLGHVDLVPGDTVVVSLRSALQAGAPWELLFGECETGLGVEQKPAIHACSGKNMALGVMLGILVAVLRKVGALERATPTALKVRATY